MKKTICLIFSVLLLIASVQAAAFVKYEGIDGESKDKDHQGWSDIVSFSQSIHKPGGGATGPTRRRGDVVFEDFVVVKEVDKASPKLAEAVAKGKVFPKVEIEVTASYTDAGRVTYYAYELKNVIVTSYNISGSGQDEDVPVETVTFNFEEYKVSYLERDESGNPMGWVEFLWNLVKGRA